jgi:hypothetical protein
MTTKKTTPVTVQSGAVEIQLSRPLDIDGAKVSTLTMREPLVDDQLSVQGTGTDAEQELALMANLCMLKPTDLRRLPIRDYMRLKAAFVGFID